MSQKVYDLSHNSILSSSILPFRYKSELFASFKCTFMLLAKLDNNKTQSFGLKLFICQIENHYCTLILVGLSVSLVDLQNTLLVAPTLLPITNKTVKEEQCGKEEKGTTSYTLRLLVVWPCSMSMSEQLEYKRGQQLERKTKQNQKTCRIIDCNFNDRNKQFICNNQQSND